MIPSNTIKYHCFIKLLCNLPKFVSRLAWLKKIQTTSWPPAPPTTNLHVVVDQLLGSQKSSEKKKWQNWCLLARLKRFWRVFCAFFLDFEKKLWKIKIRACRRLQMSSRWRTEDPSPGSGSIAAGQIPENHRNRSFLTLNCMYIDVGQGCVSSTGYSNNSPLCTIIYVHIEIYQSIIWQIHISNHNRNQKTVYKDLWLNLSPRICISCIKRKNTCRVFISVYTYSMHEDMKRRLQ